MKTSTLSIFSLCAAFALSFSGCGDRPKERKKNEPSFSTTQIQGKYGDFRVPSRGEVEAKKAPDDLSKAFQLTDVAVFVDTNEKTEGSLPHFSGTLNHKLKSPGHFSSSDEVQFVTHKKEDGDGVQVPASINLGTEFQFEEGKPSFVSHRLLATNVNSGHRVNWTAKEKLMHEDRVLVGDKVLTEKNKVSANVYYYEHLNRFQNEIRIEPDLDKDRLTVWAISVNLNTVIIYRLVYKTASAASTGTEREVPELAAEVEGEYLSIDVPSNSSHELTSLQDIEFQSLTLQAVTTYYESRKDKKPVFLEARHDIEEDEVEYEIIKLNRDRFSGLPMANLAGLIEKSQTSSEITFNDQVGYRVLFGSTNEDSKVSDDQEPFDIEEFPFLIDLLNIADKKDNEEDDSVEVRITHDSTSNEVDVYGIRIHEGSLVIVKAVYSADSSGY